MTRKIFRWPAMVISIIVLVVAVVAGCAKISTSSLTPQQRAVYAKVIAPCVPADPWTLLYDKTYQDAFSKCVAIPQKNWQPFEDAVLVAGLNGNLLGGGMGKYFGVTVPDLVVQFR